MAEKNQYLKMRCWILNPRSSPTQKKYCSVAKEEIDSVVKESLKKSMRKKI
jgi:hypothetical protein